LAPRFASAFHLDRPRKEDVVPVDLLVQFGLKVAQGLVKRLKVDAGWADEEQEP